MIPRMRETSSSDGLPFGGFLLVLGAGLVLSPLPVANDLAAISRALFTDGANLLDPSFLGILRFNAATDVIMLAYLLWLIALFFKKKAAFRTHLVNVLILSVLIAAMDLYMAFSTGLDAEKTRLMTLACLISVIKAAALVPYIRLSKRVRRTFVR